MLEAAVSRYVSVKQDIIETQVTYFSALKFEATQGYLASCPAITDQRSSKLNPHSVTRMYSSR